MTVGSQFYQVFNSTRSSHVGNICAGCTIGCVTAALNAFCGTQTLGSICFLVASSPAILAAQQRRETVETRPTTSTYYRDILVLESWENCATPPCFAARSTVGRFTNSSSAAALSLEATSMPCLRTSCSISCLWRPFPVQSHVVDQKATGAYFASNCKGAHHP